MKFKKIDESHVNNSEDEIMCILWERKTCKVEAESAD